MSGAIAAWQATLPSGYRYAIMRSFRQVLGEVVGRAHSIALRVGELPLDVCSVWVHDDTPLDHARELLNSVLSGNLARKMSAQHWTCNDCGEALEGQFTACWRCGVAKPAQA